MVRSAGRCLGSDVQEVAEKGTKTNEYSERPILFQKHGLFAQSNLAQVTR